MELVSADNDGCTVRFNREEYAALMSIVRIVRIDFVKLDHALLHLPRDVVSKIEDDVYAVAGQFLSRRKYGK